MAAVGSIVKAMKGYPCILSVARTAATVDMAANETLERVRYLRDLQRAGERTLDVNPATRGGLPLKRRASVGQLQSAGAGRRTG